MECKHCKGICIKKGCQNRRQKYCCKACGRYQQKTYTYKLCTADDDQNIIKLNNIGVGINGIASFTGISKANVVNKIKQLSKKIKKPVITENQQEYEVDEMHTIIKSKSSSCYIIYAINKNTKQVIDFTLGARTKENIGKVISALVHLIPKKIFTDNLNIYPGLIAKSIHSTNQYKTNRIERFNLTLRTHLKRLNRRTICFSKSIAMLESCLKLYFWQ
ncbi:MAG: mobile element protein [Bacteroidetes bacterium]|nr:mobile element protein [Bacteroidota bacterium]